MKLIAPGVRQFRFLWPNLINAYMVEDVVVDAGTRWDKGAMLRQLKGEKVSGVALTHAHPDHQGCAAAICSRFGVPLMVHEADVESAEGRAPLVRQNALLEMVGNVIWAGRRSPVGRVLRAGDEVVGFKVHHMPGHTRGAIMLFRAHDRVAIVGDVFCTGDPAFLTLPYMREPPFFFSVNPAQNRESIRKVWELQPRVVCSGHGPVLFDMRKLERFVQRLK